MEQRQCLCCRVRFIPSRNEDQRYCSKSACQKKRRSKYQKQKLKQDGEYKETHRSSQRKWRAKNPDYWSQYRLQHPHYVVINRVKQAIRDSNRRKKKSKILCDFLLANMYPLSLKNEYISNGYKIFLCKNLLANMYSIGMQQSIC
jgi:hypothetical protein